MFYPLLRATAAQRPSPPAHSARAPAFAPRPHATRSHSLATLVDGTSAPPIQRLIEHEEPEQDYGLGVSREAMLKRVEDHIDPRQNIATFSFAPRPDLEGKVGEEPGFTSTKASTGVGTYVTVSNRTQAEKKINTSHSEHQLIHGELKELRDAEQFPQRYIIDWVYTERPACPDVWYGSKFVAKGCKTELKEIEDLQRLRVWDVGERPELLPYATRDDLEIIVYSTFSSSTEIRAAAFFAPVRRDVWLTLRDRVITLYQDAYAESGKASEEYDLEEYEQHIPERACEVADELPSWSDYVLELSQKGEALFRANLEEEATELVGRERDALAREDEPTAMQT